MDITIPINPNDSILLDQFGFQYKLIDDNQYHIIAYSGLLNDINIPSYLNNLPITGIQYKTFADTKITNINIPDTITTIGKQAFYNTTNLTQININTTSQLNTIRQSAFNSSGIKSINIPDSVSLIERGAFLNTFNLMEVNISNDCKIVTFHDSVFYKSNINSINIPDTVASISISAFENTPNLTQINISNSQLQYIDDRAFYNSNISSINIPNTVLVIGNYAFSNNKNLTEINIANESSLTTIQESAFSYTNINTINIPQTVNNMYNNVFNKCDNLESIYFQGELPTIMNDTFKINQTINKSPVGYFYLFPSWKPYINSTLNDLKLICIATPELKYKFINDTYHIIGYDGTFTDIYIPAYVDNFPLTAIELNSFRGKNITSIYIPETITHIGADAFNAYNPDEISPLTNITFAENSQLRRINDRAFFHAGITSITIPDSVTYLGINAFHDAFNLTECIISNNSKLTRIELGTFYSTAIVEFNLPDSIISIGDSAFSNSLIEPKLKRFNISNNSKLINIEDNVFEKTNITTLNIPKYVSSIGNYIISGCKLLSSIYFQGDIPSIADNTFKNDNSIIGYHYNFPLWINYRNNNNILQSINLEYMMTSGLKTGIANNTLTISGYDGVDTDICIPSKINNILVTSISSNAFINKLITQINIPDSVTLIGGNAFKNTTNLTQLIINNISNLQKIDNNAFEFSGIKNINIPDSVTSIGNYALNEANKLTQITINNTSKLNNIAQYTFNKTSITNINIPDSITSIGTYAFSNIPNLTEVNISNNSKLQTINSFAFYASNIITINIPKLVKNIDLNAFSGSTLLYIVNFNGDLPIINNAFTNINKNAIGYHNNLTSWKKYRMFNNKLQGLELINNIKLKDMLSLIISGKCKTNLYNRTATYYPNINLLTLNTSKWETIPEPIVYNEGDIYYNKINGYISGLNINKTYKVDIILNISNLSVAKVSWESTLLNITLNEDGTIKSQDNFPQIITNKTYQIGAYYPTTMRLTTFITNCAAFALVNRIASPSTISSVINYTNCTNSTNIKISIFEI